VTELTALLRFFNYSDLPLEQQHIGRHFADLAAFIVRDVPANSEQANALRKLIEARDAAFKAREM
jgi:hypothetical protein